MSASRSAGYDSLYGIPIRYSLDPAVEAEAVRIDLKQTRVDGRAEIDTGSGFIDSDPPARRLFRLPHCELDEAGAIGTDLLQQGL